MVRYQPQYICVKALDRIDARQARHKERGLTARQNELHVTFTERRIDGDDNRADIDAGKVKDCEFTAVWNHHGYAVGLADAAVAKVGSQSAGLPVKLAVS